MKAQLKRLHSPDIVDLEKFSPEETENFCFLLQAFIGPIDMEGEESFDFMVCTTEWLKNKVIQEKAIFGQDFIIVDTFDFSKIKEKINAYIQTISENEWEALANKIDRIGKWEFRDYQKLN